MVYNGNPYRNGWFGGIFLMLKTFLHFAPFATELRVNSLPCNFLRSLEPSNWASLAATVATYLFRTTLAKWEANRNNTVGFDRFWPYQVLDDIEVTEVSKVYDRRILYTEFYYMLCLWDIMHWFHVSRVHTRFPSKSNAWFSTIPRDERNVSSYQSGHRHR